MLYYPQAYNRLILFTIDFLHYTFVSTNLRDVLLLDKHSHATKSPYIPMDITTMPPMMKYAASSDMPGCVTELRGRHFTMPVLFAV